MLSRRAERFLETLERRPSIPTNDVEAMILDQSYPCYPCWLEFHERYAGYVEVFGRDSAIWGLAHMSSEWLVPRKVDVDCETNEDVWYITCADVHPSYNYRLDNKGEFLGGPAATFDVHVERAGAFFDFQQDGHCRPLTSDELRTPQLRQMVNRTLRADLVAEASDSFFKYYMNDTYLVVESGKTRALVRGIVKVT
jgi:hypothetical protein